MNPNSIRYRLALAGHFAAVIGSIVLTIAVLPLSVLWWLLTAGGPVRWVQVWDGRLDALQRDAATLRAIRRWHHARPPLRRGLVQNGGLDVPVTNEDQT